MAVVCVEETVRVVVGWWDRRCAREGLGNYRYMWLSQIDILSSKQTPDARKTRFSLFGFNLTQARAADDELWCVYDPVFDLFLPCEPAA